MKALSRWAGGDPVLDSRPEKMMQRRGQDNLDLCGMTNTIQ
jgi:hypothetical protein